jgi:hypothetical protein
MVEKGSMMRDFSAFGCGRSIRVPFAEKPGNLCLRPAAKEIVMRLT